MKTNDILSEIRRTRDDLAQEAGYNLQQLFDYVCQREREAVARGVKFVSHAEDNQRSEVPSCGKNLQKPDLQPLVSGGDFAIHACP
jgi:hypothetical protein